MNMTQEVVREQLNCTHLSSDVRERMQTKQSSVWNKFSSVSKSSVESELERL